MTAMADLGAVGDVYVSESYYGDILQYDGKTGDSVGTFAVSPGSSTPLGQEWGPRRQPVCLHHVQSHSLEVVEV
jgi:hypothetical protein